MLLGIVVCLVYLAGLIGLQKASGVPYSAIADSEPNLRKGVLIPVGIMTAVLVAFLAATGRLAGALSFEPRVQAVWLWAIPVVLLLGVILRLVRNPWGRIDGRFVLVALLATFLVGVSEELLVRGFLVDVLQDAGLGLVWVSIVSSAVFGLLHGANIINGQDVRTTIQQVIGSAVMGLGFFASLALTGTLWLPILMHFLFDFSLVVGGSVKREAAQTGKDEVLLILALYGLSLASILALVLA